MTLCPSLAVSTSCSVCKPLPPVIVERAAGLCLKEPPPQTPALVLEGPQAGCPAAFAGCLTPAGGLALETKLRAFHRWQNEAWARCGPVPDAGVEVAPAATVWDAP